jgi:hypothetical protein
VPDTASEEFLEKFAEQVVLECEAEIIAELGNCQGSADVIQGHDAGLTKASTLIINLFDVVD